MIGIDASEAASIRPQRIAADHHQRLPHQPPGGLGFNKAAANRCGSPISINPDGTWSVQLQ